MRVAIECRSPLLQKSLELLLGKHLSSNRASDLLIKDTKCDDERCFYIGSSDDADLKKPFTKSQLMFALERRYEAKLETPHRDDEMGFELLERRINTLTREYEQNIIKAIKAFYEH
ncbi:MAG: hypothetical protein WCR69_02290 [Sulfuricurvum sp.]